MSLRKCPKCEVNYIRDDQQFCEVCSRKHKLRERDEEENDVVLCSECGEHPAMKGKDLCKYCYAEKTRLEKALKESASDEDNFDDDEIDDEESDDDISFNDDEMDDEIDDEIDEPDMLTEEDTEYDEEKVNYVLNDDYNSNIYPD